MEMREDIPMSVAEMMATANTTSTSVKPFRTFAALTDIRAFYYGIDYVGEQTSVALDGKGTSGKEEVRRSGFGIFVKTVLGALQLGKYGVFVELYFHLGEFEGFGRSVSAYPYRVRCSTLRSKTREIRVLRKREPVSYRGIFVGKSVNGRLGGGFRLRARRSFFFGPVRTGRLCGIVGFFVRASSGRRVCFHPPSGANVRIRTSVFAANGRVLVGTNRFVSGTGRGGGIGRGRILGGRSSRTAL